MNLELQNIIPELGKINDEIAHTYSAIRFLQIHGTDSDVTEWERKNEKAKEKKRKFLKPIFGE